MNGSALTLGLVGALAAAGVLGRRVRPRLGSSSLLLRGSRLTKEVLRRGRRRLARCGARNGGADPVAGLSEDMRALWSVIGITDLRDRAVEYAYTYQGHLRDAMEDEGWRDLADRLLDDGDAGAAIQQIDKRDDGWLERWSEDVERQMMRQEPSGLPSFAFFSEPKVRRNAWIFHFTQGHASRIESQGFTRGVPEPNRLGLTKHLSQSVKGQPGYVFGFLPEDVSRYAWDRYRPRYGDQAVVFRADAVVAYHWGDEERQAICWGPEAKDIHRVHLDGKTPGLSGRLKPVAGIQTDYDEDEDVTWFDSFPSLASYLDVVKLPSARGREEDELLRLLSQQGFGSASRKAGGR